MCRADRGIPLVAAGGETADDPIAVGDRVAFLQRLVPVQLGRQRQAGQVAEAVVPAVKPPAVAKLTYW